jgi:hypothetical protein
VPGTSTRTDSRAVDRLGLGDIAVEELDIDTALEWRGRPVVDRAGERIGTLADIYLDETERPHWGSIKTGLFGLRETLVPLTDARPENEVLRLPYDGDHVKNAPNLDPDVQLSDEEEEELFRHYRLGPSSEDASTETGAVAAPEAAEGSDEPEAGDERADDAMTRSEEEVRIRKQRRERGRARLRKYVVTDYVEKKVPVQREEVRLEYEPADEADRGT